MSLDGTGFFILKHTMQTFAPETALWVRDLDIENKIYIREEFKESLGINIFSPFQPEREFKVYKSCKCSQIICSRVH